MKVISTNIGSPTSITWNGKTEQTGIFKFPVNSNIILGPDHVEGDWVSDRKHHGGEYKACYLFASDNYAYWKERYPDLPWDWGMFGENVTVQGLDESQIIIGSAYRLGTALVQITLPREPCYKLGIRFRDQNIIDEFIHHGHPGTYVRVLKQGEVSPGDHFCLVEEATDSPSIADLYALLYQKEKNISHLEMALESEFIPPRTKEKLSKHQKKRA